MACRAGRGQGVPGAGRFRWLLLACMPQGATNAAQCMPVKSLLLVDALLRRVALASLACMGRLCCLSLPAILVLTPFGAPSLVRGFKQLLFRTSLPWTLCTKPSTARTLSG